jgi:heme/copper-type cytochrome/quinol oxidase subunit 2
MDYGNSNKPEGGVSGTLIATVGIVAVLLAIGGFLIAQFTPVLFPTQASAESLQIDQLFAVLLGIGGAIFLLVEGALLYSILRFRVKPGEAGDGPTVHGNATLEMVWTGIPAVIVVFLAIYSFSVWQDIRAPKENEMVVYATGARFAWTFNYNVPITGDTLTAFEQEERMSALKQADDDSLYLPVSSNILYTYVGDSVRMILNTQDVIHAFWVPEMRIKQDLLPGRTTEARFTPIAADDVARQRTFTSRADNAIAAYREDGDTRGLNDVFGRRAVDILALATTFDQATFDAVVKAVRDTRAQYPTIEPYATQFLESARAALPSDDIRALVDEATLQLFAESFIINYSQYRVVCTELCGSGHGNMYAFIRIYDSEEAYLRSFIDPAVDRAVNPPDNPVVRGAQILASGAYPCSGCHLLQESPTDDAGNVYTIEWAGVTGPSLEGVADRVSGVRSSSTGEAAEEYIFHSLYVPGAYLVPGFGNLMNNFQYSDPTAPNYMPKEDAKAIVAYLCTISDVGESVCDLDNLDTYAEAFTDDN